MALGFINRGFYNGKGLGRFRSKQIGCNKRLDLLIVVSLTEFHCIISREHAKLIADLNLEGSNFFPTSVSAKTLGVILNQDLSLSLHILKVISVCYLNLCNLSRIGSKLSNKLKLQLVHSMIVSHLDYCYALHYNLPFYLLKKLSGMLNAPVRFNFNLHSIL